jgi:hypothetical protein
MLSTALRPSAVQSEMGQPRIGAVGEGSKRDVIITADRGRRGGGKKEGKGGRTEGRESERPCAEVEKGQPPWETCR